MKNEHNATDDFEMKDEYDFRNARPNPYVQTGRKQITIRIDAEAIEYFKAQAADVGIPYQSLINMYLMDCSKKQKKLDISWK